ncbi:MAG: tetratricopeptide repeat protein [Bacteroidales bacterium]|jgi:tetratricopeptide (TPR) repeat protein|nr:tetratricopeptide repeat protein [Bacteroidales bacterium]MCI2121837.1 tetratricopeptide repeat protein [Bacteroidales bacterium]MCI2146041.1 tetratricopeptide repeat protein [Bacteroidales bacterium]
MKHVFSFPISLAVLLLFSALMPADAQKRGYDAKRDIGIAKELYDAGQWASARSRFEAAAAALDEGKSAEQAEIQSYIVLCAIGEGVPGLDGMVEGLEKSYPYAPMVSHVKFVLSSRYFDEKEYGKALKLENSIKSTKLYRSERDRYGFEKAYSNMMFRNFEEAEAGFRKVSGMNYGRYTNPSNYYLGYLYYMSGDFEAASGCFEKSARDGRFAVYSKYFLLESRLMLKDYGFVVENGPVLYGEVPENYKAGLSRMISNAYYEIGNIGKAKEYLDDYRNSGADFSRKDSYYAGLISYSIGQYIPAIEAFTRSTGEDSLGQNAYYHLAKTYLKVRNKHAALASFKFASELGFDPVMAEDAFYNYAKLSFDLNSDVSGFDSYLRAYPGTSRADEIHDYMAASYIIRKDYQSAIDALRLIRKPTELTRKNLQRAAFFRGLEYVGMRSYREAADYFNTALDNDVDAGVTDLSYLYLAECYYRDGKYAEAISIDGRLARNRSSRNASFYPAAVFTLAYSYLKSGDYRNAANWFRTYLDLPSADRPWDADARARLADAIFMQKDFPRAADAYQGAAAAGGPEADYAMYQSAISYGLMNDETSKIRILDSIMKGPSNAGVYPMAVFELGRTYVRKGDKGNARLCFEKLMEGPTDSTFYAKSLLELAMMASNSGDYDGSINYYKTILEKYRLSSVTEDALSGLESVFQTIGKPEVYLAYLDSLGMSAHKSASEKELMLFNAAEQKYLSKDYGSAIASLRSFLEQYPDGIKNSQAHYYLAECYRNTNRMDAAADEYLKVMNLDDKEFIEPATLNYAEVSYNTDHFDEAVKAYETLSYIATNDNNKHIAAIGLMLSCFKDRMWEKAVSQAEKVLSMKPLSEDEMTRAQYVIAKGEISMGRREDAKKMLKNLSQKPATPEGAESCYLLAQDAYDEGDFDKTEKLVYAFSDSGTPQTYWLAKSFIVLGDSFADRNDWDQAKATFDSIKENYKPRDDKDDILGQVEMRLKKIDSMIKKEDEND